MLEEGLYEQSQQLAKNTTLFFKRIQHKWTHFGNNYVYKISGLGVDNVADSRNLRGNEFEVVDFDDNHFIMFIGKYNMQEGIKRPYEAIRRGEVQVTKRYTSDFYYKLYSGQIAMDKLDNKALDESKSKSKAKKGKNADKPLNKPMRGDVKKYKVYVKDPRTGNVKKVNFGDKNMEIKRDDPERRKSFRARHNCDSAKDKTTPRHWSCKMWRKGKSVGDTLKGENIVKEFTANQIKSLMNKQKNGQVIKEMSAKEVKAHLNKKKSNVVLEQSIGDFKKKINEMKGMSFGKGFKKEGEEDKSKKKKKSKEYQSKGKGSLMLGDGFRIDESMLPKNLSQKNLVTLIENIVKSLKGKSEYTNLRFVDRISGKYGLNESHSKSMKNIIWSANSPKTGLKLYRYIAENVTPEMTQKYSGFGGLSIAAPHMVKMIKETFNHYKKTNNAQYAFEMTGRKLNVPVEMIREMYELQKEAYKMKMEGKTGYGKMLKEGMEETYGRYQGMGEGDMYEMYDEMAEMMDYPMHEEMYEMDMMAEIGEMPEDDYDDMPEDDYPMPLDYNPEERDEYTGSEYVDTATQLNRLGDPLDTYWEGKESDVLEIDMGAPEPAPAAPNDDMGLDLGVDAMDELVGMEGDYSQFDEVYSQFESMMNEVEAMGEEGHDIKKK